MRSAMPMARARLLLPVLAMLGLQACAGGQLIVATPSACSTLVPDAWREPVPGAPLPAGETVGDWIAFGDAQTAQLDKANGRTVDALAIISRCEARDAKAVQRARPKLLRVL